MKYLDNEKGFGPLLLAGIVIGCIVIVRLVTR